MISTFTYSRLTVIRKTAKIIKKSISSNCQTSRKVLGIETSCDDTGAAVVDDKKNILGDAIKSQVTIHTEYEINFNS